MKRLVLAAALLAQPAAADADRIALELGSMLAAEEPCGLAFDHDAIGDWIDAQVDADDMGFAGNLAMMTQGQAFQIGRMSDSQRAAHCAQTRRVARSMGFTAAK